MPVGGIAQLHDPLRIFVSNITCQAKSKEEGVVGLEFENEMITESGPYSDFPGWPAINRWKYHSENSLRYYGFEHVSRPLKITEYKDTVNYLFTELLDILNSNIKKPVTSLPFTNSIRTSVHVHFDVGQYNTIDLMNFVSLYWILEPYLQHFCGKWRQGNLFCLRLKDTTYTKILLADSLFSRKNIFSNPITLENNRYGSINFNSLVKFGTIEFRMMRGVSTPEDAFIWVDALEKIRQFALQFRTTNDLRNFFLNGCSADEIPKLVLGPTLSKIYDKHFPNHLLKQNEIRDGWLSVSPILSVNTNWTEKQIETARKKEQAQPSHSLETLLGNYDSSAWASHVPTSHTPNLTHTHMVFDPNQNTYVIHEEVTPANQSIPTPEIQQNLPTNTNNWIINTTESTNTWQSFGIPPTVSSETPLLEDPENEDDESSDDWLLDDDYQDDILLDEMFDDNNEDGTTTT